MSLVSLTVRGSKRKFDRSIKNFSSEAQGYDDTRIISVVPSLCKKDGVTDGLVVSRVQIDDGNGENQLSLWVTQDVATIVALT